jgi:hypothetical protein
MKFDMFPPGQEATRIIPKAILGDGFKTSINKKVNKGRAKNCDKNPAKIDLGNLNTCKKLVTLNCSATPNIIKPRDKFNIITFSALKFNLTSSIFRV